MSTNNHVPLLRALKMSLNFDIGHKAIKIIIRQLSKNIYTEYINIINEMFLDIHDTKTFIEKLNKDIRILLTDNKIFTKSFYKDNHHLINKQTIINNLKLSIESSEIHPVYKHIILNLHNDFMFDVVTANMKSYSLINLKIIFFKNIISNEHIQNKIKEELVLNKYDTMTNEFNECLSNECLSNECLSNECLSNDDNTYLFKFNKEEIENWWFRYIFYDKNSKLRMKKIMINCIEDILQINISSITPNNKPIINQSDMFKIINSFKQELLEQDPEIINHVNVYIIETLNNDIMIKLINELINKKYHANKKFDFDELVFKQSVIDKYKRSKEETLNLLRREYKRIKLDNSCLNDVDIKIKHRKQPKRENEKKLISFFHELDRANKTSKINKSFNLNNLTARSIISMNQSKVIAEIKKYSNKNNMRLSQSLNMRLYLINLVTEYKYNDKKMNEYKHYSIKVDNWHELLENKVEDFFKQRSVKFITEKDLKNIDKEIYDTSFYKSPDVLLLDDVYINGKLVRWIDAKNIFGNSLYKSPKRIMDFNKQMNDYVELFGPGAIVFGHGYSTDYDKLLKSTTSTCIKENFDQAKMDQVLLIDGLDMLGIEFLLPWSLDIEQLPLDQDIKNAYGNKISYIDPIIL
jgi:hypothetical protein